MKLLGNRVLVRLDPPPTESFVLVEHGKSKLQSTGIVLLLGSGGRRGGRPNLLPPDLRVGHRVHVDNSYGSQETDFNGQKCRVYSIRDVVAILG